MAVSVLLWVSDSDHRLMRRVNRWTPPRWMRLWMVAATRGGDGWLWYAIAAAVLLDGGTVRFQALLAALLAVSAGIALFVSVKRACGRRRPCATEPHCWACTS
jgi:undecaprenyl-diphosphatase